MEFIRTGIGWESIKQKDLNMRFVTEYEISEVVHSMLQEAPEAILAVAFWGIDAIGRLGLDRRPDGAMLKIVCNLDSGACNPCAIQKLLDIPNVRVRNLSKLHGKVYWTPRQVVIGSSNASANGLVARDAAGWMEANVLTSEISMIQRSGEWCRSCFDNGSKITEELLNQSQQVWERRQKMSPASGGLSRSLLRSFAAQPDHPIFTSVKLLAWEDPVTKQAQEEHIRLQEHEPVYRGTEVYEGWGNSIEKGDWLIDIPCPKGAVKIYEVLGDYPFKERHAARAGTHIALDAFGSLEVSAEDRRKLATYMRQRGGADHIVISLPDLRTEAPHLFSE